MNKSLQLTDGDLEPDEVNLWSSLSCTCHRCHAAAFCSRLPELGRLVNFRRNCPHNATAENQSLSHHGEVAQPAQVTESAIP